jgi:hypothetical protein
MAIGRLAATVMRCCRDSQAFSVIEHYADGAGKFVIR